MAIEMKERSHRRGAALGWAIIVAGLIGAAVYGYGLREGWWSNAQRQGEPVSAAPNPHY